MRALNSVIAAMLADKQSISSSIFLKSFFIFLIVSVKCHNKTANQKSALRTYNIPRRDIT